MSDDALSQIMDAYASMMRATPAFADEPVEPDKSPDDAIEDGALPCWVIYCEAYDFDDAPNQGQTEHKALLNFERIETSGNIGMVSRANRNAIAQLIAGMNADPSLGNRLQDFAPLNVAPPMDNGKSVGGASLQIQVLFYTPIGDHFTIVS